MTGDELADAGIQPAKCGAGTVVLGQQCVPNDGCEAGEVRRGGFCRRPRLRIVAEPFSAGTAYTLGAPLVESNDPRDRRGRARYGMRLVVAAGGTVSAMRPGRVRHAANEGQTTRVVVDHGDESFAYYVSSEPLTLAIATGDLVCTGTPLAQSTSAFEVAVDVRNLNGFSQRLRIALGDDERGGLAEGVEETSSQPPTTCGAQSFSGCSASAFLHRGVQLDSGTPCSVLPASGQVVVRGGVVGDYAPGARVAYWDPATRNLACTDIVDRRFEVTLSIDGVPGTDMPWHWQVADANCVALDWGETPAIHPTVTLVSSLQDGAAAEISCGVGTAENDTGVCEPVDCGQDVYAGGACVPLAGRTFAYPFASGTQTPLFGGYHAWLSHRGEFTHSIDFDVDVGTPVVAVADGMVVMTLDDTPGPGGEGNWIYIDHGDGLTTRYGHLRLQSQRVVVGDTVCSGQVIAESGNTGFTTAPHLHLETLDAGGNSMLMQFSEAGNDYGLLMPGRSYVSQTPAPTCSSAP